jgi:sulfate adenylyltransferase (ADP) / ATP adenylyltransferase
MEPADCPSDLRTGFSRGTLRARVAQVAAAALARGLLQPIPTETAFIDEGSVRFLVRVVSNLARKDQVRRADGQHAEGGHNPFLPFEPALYVADAGETHICLLNKFNVVDHHLLIVTRQFEPQERPLDLADFSALWRCLAEYDGLGFYNAGADAGASQPHKHLQLVPLPLTDRGPSVPIEPWIESTRRTPAGVERIPELAFPHALARLEAGLDQLPETAARVTLDLYRRLLVQLGLATDSPPPEILTPPYNLLLTRRWLLLVPRARERVAGISLNALAFAGAFLVRDRAQLERLQDLGPLTALQQAALL